MLTILICSACGPSRLAQAGAEQGRAQAQLFMPALPAECRQTLAHAAAVLGANPVVVLARERAQLDLANGVIVRCAGFYAQVKAGLER